MNLAVNCVEAPSSVLDANVDGIDKQRFGFERDYST